MEPSALPLSVAIICKDAARTIGRTLDSVRGLGAELLALDSGSTDGTIELLEHAGANVHRTDWPGYVEQKRRELASCTQEWVLSLDADESLDEELRSAIEHAVRRHTQADEGKGAQLERIGGYTMNRMVWYAGRPLRHAWQPEHRLRLVRRAAVRWVGYDPHYELRFTDPAWRAGHLRGVLRHDSIDEGLGVFLRKQASHAHTAAGALHERGVRTSPARLCVSPIGAWAKQMVVRRAFLDGWRGWAAASAAAAGTLMKHACLLELQHQDEHSRTNRTDHGRG